MDSFIINGFTPFRQDNVAEIMRNLLSIFALRQEMRIEICDIFSKLKDEHIFPGDLDEHTDLERVAFLGLPKTWVFSLKDEGPATISIPTTVFFMESKKERQEVYKKAVEQYIVDLQKQLEDLQKVRMEGLRQEYLRLHEIFGKENLTENLTKKQGETNDLRRETQCHP